MTTTPDLLTILVKQNALTNEQADRVRRSTRLGTVTAEQTVLQLGLTSESADRPGPGPRSGTSLREDQPPRSRSRRGHQGRCPGPSRGSTAWSPSRRRPTTITVAVHDPFAPFPVDDIKRVTGLDVERVVATRADVETVNKGFYDLKTSLKTAEKQLTAEPLWAPWTSANQEFLSAAVEGAGPRGRPGRQGSRPHPELRLRAARVRHPLRAQARAHARPAPHRRDPPRRPPHPQDRLPGGGLAHQAALGLQHRREAAAPGRPHQARAGRPRGRASRLDDAHRLRGEGGPADLRPRHPAEGRSTSWVSRRTTCRSSTTSSPGPRGSSWSPAPRAAARPPPSTRCSSTCPGPR